VQTELGGLTDVHVQIFPYTVNIFLLHAYQRKPLARRDLYHRNVVFARNLSDYFQILRANKPHRSSWNDSIRCFIPLQYGTFRMIWHCVPPRLMSDLDQSPYGKKKHIVI
jgi:hypothetical protein